MRISLWDDNATRRSGPSDVRTNVPDKFSSGADMAPWKQQIDGMQCRLASLVSMRPDAGIAASGDCAE